MKLELKDNKVFFENKGLKKEIHPFWLRERVNGENFVDKSTQQRLFDPTQLQENIQIQNLNLSSDFLEIKFNDGASTKISIIDIFKEFSNINDVKQIEKIKWDSSFKDQNSFEFKDNLFETPPLFSIIQKESSTEWKEMYKVFNMGHRMELYVKPNVAEEIVNISKSFGVNAKVIGRVEPSDIKKLTIRSEHGTFEY